MLINTDKMISISEANQNFSKVAKMVDEAKVVVILKNNKPKYLLMEFEEFSKESMTENDRINDVADKVLNDNIEAFKNIAKPQTSQTQDDK